MKISSAELQQDAGRSGRLSDQAEGEGFSDAHSAFVIVAPKVLLVYLSLLISNGWDIELDPWLPGLTAQDVSSVFT